MPSPIVRTPTPRLTSLFACGALLVLPLTAFQTRTPPRPATQDAMADSLIGLWIDSVGGMETFGALRTAHFTVTTQLFDTLSGRLKRSRPRYAWIKQGPHGEETRVERWEGDDFIIQGFNGRDPAWAVMNGAGLSDTAMDAREALYVARDLFYWIGLPFKLRDPGVHLRYLGLRERPGRPWAGELDRVRRAPNGRYHAVQVSFGPGIGEHSDVFTYYFAPGRGFPFEVTYVEEGRTNINRLIWGSTERVGDIAFPYVVRRDFITESGKRTKALMLGDVAINLDVPQVRFERP